MTEIVILLKEFLMFVVDVLVGKSNVFTTGGQDLAEVAVFAHIILC